MFRQRQVRHDPILCDKCVFYYTISITVEDRSCTVDCSSALQATGCKKSQQCNIEIEANDSLSIPKCDISMTFCYGEGINAILNSTDPQCSFNPLHCSTNDSQTLSPLHCVSYTSQTCNVGPTVCSLVSDTHSKIIIMCSTIPIPEITTPSIMWTTDQGETTTEKVAKFTTEPKTSMGDMNPTSISSTTPATMLTTSHSQLDTQPTTNSGSIISILLAVIIVIMALFICVFLVSLITMRARKHHQRSRVNNRGLQENIYQTVDGNRRPSRIIPINTHGGQCFEFSEFPRYDNLGDNIKLSDMSPSKHCADKGDFYVDMRTGSKQNGYPSTEEHFYADIPATSGKTAGHNQNPPSKVRSKASVLPPLKEARLSTTSSQLSLTYDIIDPYSTLDEAKSQALMEIKSTKCKELSDDILMLNVFGSEKPKWTSETRPLKLNIPSEDRAGATGGRLSLEEDEYIQMAGDLEGGWGEVHSHGFDYYTVNHERDTTQGKSGFPFLENKQQNRATPRRANDLEEPDGNNSLDQEAPSTSNENMEEPPPIPDRNYEYESPIHDASIEDLYAKVRKKKHKCSDSFDDDMIIVGDNEDNKQPLLDYLDSSGLHETEHTNTTNDSTRLLDSTTEPIQTPLLGKKAAAVQHLNAQDSKRTQHAQNTHTL